MRVLNIADPEFTYDDDDPPPFHAGMFRLGRQLGATQTGMSVYELPPGQSVCPYHYEYGEEEWLLVLEGNPTLRTPAGEEQIGPMEMVFFPTGPEGAPSRAPAQRRATLRRSDSSFASGSQTPVRPISFQAIAQVPSAVAKRAKERGGAIARCYGAAASRGRAPTRTARSSRSWRPRGKAAPAALPAPGRGHDNGQCSISCPRATRASAAASC